jgi:hypothetical protein
MAFNPHLFNTPRNRLVAERERLAAEERRLAKQIDKLRSQRDDLSNLLRMPNPSLAETRQMMDREAQQRLDWGPGDPVRVAKMIVECGERAKARTPVPLP